MTTANAEKKRNRRSIAQLLVDYRTMLEKFDAKAAAQREKLVSKIERIESRHSLMALAIEALGDKSADQATAELEEQIEQLRLRRKAIKRFTKTA